MLSGSSRCTISSDFGTPPVWTTHPRRGSSGTAPLSNRSLGSQYPLWGRFPSWYQTHTRMGRCDRSESRFRDYTTPSTQAQRMNVITTRTAIMKSEYNPCGKNPPETTFKSPLDYALYHPSLVFYRPAFVSSLLRLSSLIVLSRDPSCGSKRVHPRSGPALLENRCTQSVLRSECLSQGRLK